MSEKRIVNWDNAQTMGELDIADHVDKPNDYKTLHLELLHFPEEEALYEEGRAARGYHAVRIIGTTMGSLGSDRNARGIGVTRSRITRLPIALEGEAGELDGRVIHSVTYHDHSMQTIIRPADDLYLKEHSGAPQTVVSLTPERRKFELNTSDVVPRLRNARVSLSISENGGRRSGAILINTKNQQTSRRDQTIIQLDHNGQAGVIETYTDRIDTLVPGQADRMTMLSRRHILDGVANSFGLGERWRGVDLRLSALCIYEAMRHSNFKPFESVIPNEII